jgi:hypothetical protein
MAKSKKTFSALVPVVAIMALMPGVARALTMTINDVEAAPGNELQARSTDFVLYSTPLTSQCSEGSLHIAMLNDLDGVAVKRHFTENGSLACDTNLSGMTAQIATNGSRTNPWVVQFRADGRGVIEVASDIQFTVHFQAAGSSVARCAFLTHKVPFTYTHGHNVQLTFAHAVLLLTRDADTVCGTPDTTIGTISGHFAVSSREGPVAVKG